MAAEDTIDLTEPFYNFAPENFRIIMQKQIESHVQREVDGITLFNFQQNPNSDGRYSSSRPAPTTQMTNPYGFRYFVVGASIVGTPTVAAP